MDLYPIQEINADREEILEQLGTKEKFWLRHEGQLKLIKFGREGTGENWAEKVACEVCRALGMPHAEYELGLFVGRSCVVSPTLIPEGGRLILGNELLSRRVKGYGDTTTYQQKDHTVSRVLASLATYATPEPNAADALKLLPGYLMLDALIGNTDRHHENWGLIVDRNQNVTLAPTFDHASSLGRELSDELRLARLNSTDPRQTVATYAERARSALYDVPGSRKPLHPRRAFEIAAQHQPDAGRAWLDKLQHLELADIDVIVHSVPAEVMSEAAKNFAMQLMTHNRLELLKLHVTLQ